MDVHEGVALPLRLHNVLLALSGRLDDTALGESRHLAARALFDEAAELIVGALAAGRIAVGSAERAELTEVLGRSGADTALAELLRVNDAEADTGTEHRFSADDAPEEGVADAIEPVTQLLPDVRKVHAVWRNTVAGSVPGPMPQRLVLVEVGSEGSAPATAYRMDVALRRAGIRAVVEVSAPGSDWSGYHRAALATAVPVRPAASVPVTYVEPEPAPEPTADTRPEPPADEPEPVPAREPGPAAVVEPEPEPEPGPAAVAEPEPEPEPGPAAVVEPEPEPEPEPGRRAAEPEPEPVETSWDEQPSADAWAPSDAEDLVPGELFWPQSDREPETRAESTADLTASESGQLRAALRREEPTGEQIDAKTVQRQAVELPAAASDEHSLNDRDRALLRELHAELAKREREQAAQVRMNGWEHQG